MIVASEIKGCNFETKFSSPSLPHVLEFPFLVLQDNLYLAFLLYVTCGLINIYKRYSTKVLIITYCQSKNGSFFVNLEFRI